MAFESLPLEIRASGEGRQVLISGLQVTSSGVLSAWLQPELLATLHLSKPP